MGRGPGWPFWITLSRIIRYSEIMIASDNQKKNTHQLFVVSTASADGLALLSARPYAGTLMTKLRSHIIYIYIGNTLEGSYKTLLLCHWNNYVNMILHNLHCSGFLVFWHQYTWKRWINRFHLQRENHLVSHALYSSPTGREKNDIACQ